jgi:ankyrin repeat protein
VGGKGSTGGGGGKQLEMRPMTMISACGQNGRTPLHDAAFNDRIDLVFELALQYRNYDIVDDNGWTALHCAASQGNLEILMILLRSPNVSINRQTKSGSTVLHYLMRLKPTPSELNLYLQVCFASFHQLIS